VESNPFGVIDIIKYAYCLTAVDEPAVRMNFDDSRKELSSVMVRPLNLGFLQTHSSFSRESFLSLA